MSIFELASRRKLRFSTSVGELTVEDLWTLPMTHAKNPNLDDLARTLFLKIRDAEIPSFVKPSSGTESETQLKFDIVKHIISVKIQEADQANQAKSKEDKKALLQEIIQEKKNASLKEKSVAELEAELAAL